MSPRFSSVPPMRPDRPPGADRAQANTPPHAPRWQRPERTPMDKNEYAGFAAQLAARSERLRAGTSAAPSPPSPGAPAEAPRARAGLSRRAAEWAGRSDRRRPKLPPPPPPLANEPHDRHNLSRLAARPTPPPERPRAKVSPAPPPTPPAPKEPRE